MLVCDSPFLSSYRLHLFSGLLSDTEGYTIVGLLQNVLAKGPVCQRLAGKWRRKASFQSHMLVPYLKGIQAWEVLFIFSKGSSLFSQWQEASLLNAQPDPWATWTKYWASLFTKDFSVFCIQVWGNERLKTNDYFACFSFFKKKKFYFSGHFSMTFGILSIFEKKFSVFLRKILTVLEK